MFKYSLEFGGSKGSSNSKGVCQITGPRLNVEDKRAAALPSVGSVCDSGNTAELDEVPVVGSVCDGAPTAFAFAAALTLFRTLAAKALFDFIFRLITAFCLRSCFT